VVSVEGQETCGVGCSDAGRMACAGCEGCGAALLCIDAVCVGCYVGSINTIEIVDELHVGVPAVGETGENRSTWDAERNERRSCASKREAQLRRTTRVA
jgi:hypothetical protein